MPDSGISTFWMIFFWTCVILNYTGKQLVARDHIEAFSYFEALLNNDGSNLIPSMRVSKFANFSTSRYGREKWKCWSQIALAAMGEKGVHGSPVRSGFLSKIISPSLSFWDLDKTFSRLLFAARTNF